MSGLLLGTRAHCADGASLTSLRSVGRASRMARSSTRFVGLARFYDTGSVWERGEKVRRQTFCRRIALEVGKGCSWPWRFRSVPVPFNRCLSWE